MPGQNHTRSLVLYVAIEAVGWVTVALGVLSAGTGLLSAVPEGSSLPFNVVAATPGVTLAVAGLFAAGLAHHGRVTLEMARSLRHLVHLAATAADAQRAPPVMPAPVVAQPDLPASSVVESSSRMPEPESEPKSGSVPESDALEPAPPLPQADLIIPPLPPLEPKPMRTPATPLSANIEPDAADDLRPATGPSPDGTPEPEMDIPDPGEPDIAVYRNVQIELRPEGIFIRDRQFGSVDEARGFIDRVLDRAPR